MTGRKPKFGCKKWEEVLNILDKSEFPLVRLTPETLRKVVQE